MVETEQLLPGGRRRKRKREDKDKRLGWQENLRLGEQELGMCIVLYVQHK